MPTLPNPQPDPQLATPNSGGASPIGGNLQGGLTAGPVEQFSTIQPQSTGSGVEPSAQGVDPASVIPGAAGGLAPLGQAGQVQQPYPTDVANSASALPDLNAGNQSNPPTNSPPANNTVIGPSVTGQTNLLEAARVKNLLTSEQVQQNQQLIVTGQKTMEDVLTEAGVSEDDIYKLRAEMNGMDYIDLGEVEVPQTLIDRFPQAQARKLMAVPVEETPAGIKVAMADASDIQKTKAISAIIGSSVVPAFSTPKLINYFIDNRYGAQVGAEVAEALEDVSDTGGVELGSVVSEVTDLSTGNLASAPVSKIVNMILEYSIRYKASDIHIEPRENKISVRFRIFGVLDEKLTLPKKLLAPVVSRIKILASLKIDEHRVPQDGRFQVKLGSDSVDLRVSVVPTVYGEKVVMRLLKKGGGSLDLEDTGMVGQQLKTFLKNIAKTQGIILVTGPTGSGKTQTLASSLKRLNQEDVNIMTLENPVEIRVDGVNQVQINNEVGLTFAKGLRAFLRQDPDIIMVGEIRDAETASLAVQAALTGHLVLATLHTNSAAGAIPRLVDMEVEPFLLASTMNVVLAQRLVRRVCEDCIESYYAEPQAVEQIHKVLDGIRYDIGALPNNDLGKPDTLDDDKIVLYRGKGCAKCNDTGYSGRIGIFEALDVTEKISKAILQKGSTEDVRKLAIEDGMITMLQDGFAKALQGVTTLEEVLRVQTV